MIGDVWCHVAPHIGDHAARGNIMTYTVAQMNEARAAKRARRNRGEATGNHGMRPLTRYEQDAVDEMRFEGVDDLERGMFELVHGVAWRLQCEAEKLRMYLLENEEPDGLLEIPF